MEKKRKAFEVGLPGSRSVVLVELKTGEVRQAMELAGKIKVDDARQFETSLQGLRLSIRKIDGRDVKYEDLIGEKFDDEFSVAEATLLARAWSKIHLPNEDEVDGLAGNIKAIAS